MSTYVLIHGAYQGGWIWQPTALRLLAAGHRVYAPSLDGCGDRRHQLRPGITVETQAAEIAELLFYEDLHDVALTGTSSGGMVVCRTAEMARERIGRLVFVDALALVDGERISEIVNRPTPRVSTPLAVAPSREDAENRSFADLGARPARLCARPLYAASDRGDGRAGVAEELLVAALAGNDGDPLPPRCQPARGAPAPHRGKARRQIPRDRCRALPDAVPPRSLGAAPDAGMTIAPASAG